MAWYETKKRDNNMIPIEHDDEAWVVLAEDKVVSDDSVDFHEDKVDLKWI